MYKRTKIENILIDKIDEILNDFEDFEQPFINNSGDIIIRKKFIKRKTNDSSILTNIFKEMIKNDVKKKQGLKPCFVFNRINGALRYKFYQRLL